MRAKRIMGAALALAAMGAVPAFAQDSMQSGSMAGNSMAMGNNMAPSTMSKSQMAAMKKCQAMSSDMMMKNKKCAAMAKAHPEMMSGSMAPSGS